MRAVVIAAVMVLAACGGSATTARTNGSRSPNAQMLAFSRCMRAHGEPTFPDPDARGEVKSQLRASGIDVSSPRFQSAQAACHSKLPDRGRGMTPAQFRQMKAEALAFSRCIRAHGVRNYPDPGSDGREPDPSAVGIDESSPAWQAAHEACFHP